MERVIKFRGLRNDGKGWAYGDLCTKSPQGNAFIGIDENILEWVSVLPESVGQFTGVTDVKKKEVFEGDICIDEVGRVWVIEWDVMTCRFVLALQAKKKKFDGRIGPLRTNLQAYLAEMVEIIGSIHTNPELIKQKV
jgi:uncharacterized phage protein (TIGR01671 family)